MAMVVGGQEAKSKVEGKRASHVSRERRGRTCVQRACACVRERDSQSGEVQGERLQWAGRLLRWHCLMSTYTSVSVSSLLARYVASMVARSQMHERVSPWAS